MVQIKKQLASQDVINKRSYGKGNPVTSITVHQTGNPNKGANAEMHARLQTNLNPRQASWHYQVDDKQVVQSFPDDVRCRHATDGRGPGNTTSIAIEICINSDGDYAKAVENAAELIKIKLKEYELRINDVKQHFDWFNKFCPEQLLRGHKGILWTDFINMIKGGTNTSTPPKKQVASTTTSKPKQTGNSRIRTIQSTLNSRYNTKIAVDGFNGPQTKKANIKGYQTELNKQFKAGLIVDGIWGTKTRNASVTVRKGAKGNLTWIIQARLYCLGYDPKGLDGILGNGLAAAVRKYQSDQSINADGVPGKVTFSKLFG